MADDLIETNEHPAIPTRRRLLRGGLAVVTTWLVADLIKPLIALAAEWPKAAFDGRKLDESIRNLFETNQTTPSASIKISAPYQAENGATVRLAATTDLPNVSMIAVFIEKNERPLAMVMNFNGAQPYLSLRMKMAQTSDVYVIAKSQGKLYSAKQNIKVTVGGCGG